MNAPTVLSVWCALAARARKGNASVALNVAAGALCGAAALFKYQAAFVGVAFVFLLPGGSPRERLRDALVRGSALVVGFALPLGLAVLYFWEKGALPEAIAWGIEFNRHYLAEGPDLWTAITRFSLQFFGMVVPNFVVYGAGFWGLASLLKHGRRSGEVCGVIGGHWMLVAWTVESLVCVSLGRRFFGHYFLQPELPLALLAAAPVADLWDRRPRFVFAGVGLPALVFFLVAAFPRYTSKYVYTRDPDYWKVGRAAAMVTAPSDRIWVWGNVPQNLLHGPARPRRALHLLQLLDGTVTGDPLGVRPDRQSAPKRRPRGLGPGPLRPRREPAGARHRYGRRGDEVVREVPHQELSGSRGLLEGALPTGRRRRRRRLLPPGRRDLMPLTISERVGDFVVRVTDKVVANARLTLALSWALAIVSGWYASHLQVFGDFSSLLPPKTESVVQLRALEKRTRVLATYMIGLESDDPDQQSRAAAVLRSRLDAIDRDLVAGVTSDEHGARQFAWDNRFLFAPLDELERARDALQRKIAEANPMYVSLDDDGPSSSTDDLKDWLDKAEKEAGDPGAFVSKDGRLQLFIVRTTFSSGDDDRAHKLNGLLEGVKRETQAEFPAVTIGMAGDVITTFAEHRALVNGVVASTVATVALVIGALLLFYRSVTAVGALCWSLTVGVLATFAFTWFTIGSLNLASAFLSSIVIGNGINFGLVLLARYQEERLREPDPAIALRAAVRGAAPGTLAAALTASVAYVSLTVTPFRGFRDFGIIAASGMALCWTCAFTVLPAGLSVLGSRVKGADPARFGAWLARVVPKQARLVAATGIALLVLTTGATVRYLTHDPLEDDLRNLRSDNAALDAEGAWMSKFDRAFGNGIEGGFIIGVGDAREAPIVASKLRAVDAGKPDIEHLFSRISTLDELLPKDQLSEIAVLGDIRESLDSRLLEHLSDEEQSRLRRLRPPDNLRPLTNDDIPADLAWPYTERDGTRGRFVLANTGLGVDTWRVHALEGFARVVRGLKLGPDVLVGGSAFVFSDMLAAMQHDGPRATVAAVAGSVLVILLLLGTGHDARVTLACEALGVTGMLTAAWLLGIKVNFLDFVALPITIGIGVDYGVNIVARARQSGGPLRGRRALSTTGAVVALCSYTTCVGYGSLLFSQNRGIHTFGLSAMIGELTCLSAAMFLAPALIDYRPGRGAP